MAKMFHAEQTEHIATGKGPSDVLDGGMLVLHILPYSIVEGITVAAYDELVRHPELFPPMTGKVQDVQIGYDGVLIGSNARGLGEPQRAYVKINRPAQSNRSFLPLPLARARRGWNYPTSRLSSFGMSQITSKPSAALA